MMSFKEPSATFFLTAAATQMCPRMTDQREEWGFPSQSIWESGFSSCFCSKQMENDTNT